MIREASEMQSEVRYNMRGGEGAVTVTHLFKRDEFTSDVRLCAKLIVPPGAGIGAHKHQGEDEVYFVISGTGILDDGKSEQRIAAGDAVLTGRGESHALLNDGDEDLEILATIAFYPEE